jgi:hypothetical protein
MKDVDFDVLTPLPDGDQDVQPASTSLISYRASEDIRGIRRLLAASADSNKLVQFKDDRGYQPFDDRQTILIDMAFRDLSRVGY